MNTETHIVTKLIGPEYGVINKVFEKKSGWQDQVRSHIYKYGIAGGTITISEGKNGNTFGTRVLHIEADKVNPNGPAA